MGDAKWAQLTADNHVQGWEIFKTAVQAQGEEVGAGECLLLIQASVGYSKARPVACSLGHVPGLGVLDLCALSVPSYSFNDTLVLES